MPDKLQAVPQADIQAGDVVRDQDKIMLVLSYLGILALIPLLTVKDSDYVNFHARQGVGLMIAWIGFFIVSIILQFIPILGQVIACVGWLGLLALTIVGIIKAFKPERWRIPGVASIADMLPK